MAQLDRETIRKAIQERDAEAFDALFACYREGVRWQIAHIVRDEAAADDLVQQAFMKVWTRAEQWKGQGSFEGWLYRIATNLSLNHLRTVRRRKEHPLERQPAGAPRDEDSRHSEDEESPAPGWMIDASTFGPETEAVERREQYRRLMETLPEEHREALRLVIEEEMGIREAAEVLGVPEGTVKSRLHYAKKRLAQEWEKQNQEE
jgi:RNA polymerase sigma-70 factor (ECF subfamily)